MPSQGYHIPRTNQCRVTKSAYKQKRTHAIKCKERNYSNSSSKASSGISRTVSMAACLSATPLWAPLTARRSAASFPGSLLCPFIHSKNVLTLSLSRSSILSRIDSMRSLFSTALLLEVIQLFRRQLWNHSVTHLIEYWLSVKIVTSRCRGAMSRARRIAVSSARWLVCRLPFRGSETFLLVITGVSE